MMQPDEYATWARRMIQQERRVRRRNRALFGVLRWRYYEDRLYTWILRKLAGTKTGFLPEDRRE